MHGDLGGAAADIKDQGMTNFELFSVLTHKRCPYWLLSKIFADLNLVKRDNDRPVRQRGMGNSRQTRGRSIRTINVPGASTASGYGTIAIGINDFGAISGHFWDASENVHGFVLTPDGQFLQIDVRGAMQTWGGRPE